MIVSHWILSDSKFPQVSRTLLSILADLNNAVVWMLSTCPLISKSSCPCTNPLVTVPRASITIGITVTFMFNRFFYYLSKIWAFIFLFTCLQFTLWSAVTVKPTVWPVHFLFVDYLLVWSSCCDLRIRLYLKIPKNFVRHIFLDRFWVMHKPFVRMVKSKFLAQFLVDLLPLPSCV